MMNVNETSCVWVGNVLHKKQINSFLVSNDAKLTAGDDPQFRFEAGFHLECRAMILHVTVKFHGRSKEMKFLQ